MRGPASGSVWCLPPSKVQKSWSSRPTYLDQLLGIPPADIDSSDGKRGNREQQHTPTTDIALLRATPSSEAIEVQICPAPTLPSQRLPWPPVAEMPKRKAGEGVQKYYAVRVGVRPGIYRSWPECLAQITGFRGATCACISLSLPSPSLVDSSGPS